MYRWGRGICVINCNGFLAWKSKLILTIHQYCSILPVIFLMKILLFLPRFLFQPMCSKSDELSTRDVCYTASLQTSNFSQQCVRGVGEDAHRLSCVCVIRSSRGMGRWCVWTPPARRTATGWCWWGRPVTTPTRTWAPTSRTMMCTSTPPR